MQYIQPRVDFRHSIGLGIWLPAAVGLFSSVQWVEKNTCTVAITLWYPTFTVQPNSRQPDALPNNRQPYTQSDWD